MSDLSDSDRTIDRLTRRAARSKQARKEAERLLEEKSRELYNVNQDLRRARQELEVRVLQRTAELADATERAQRANDAKTTFLAHMSHELRTPLTSILGYTADLIEQLPEHLDLQTIERNATHLLALINEVLDLAKIESGTLQITPRPHRIGTFFEDITATIAAQAKAKDLQFTYEADLPDVLQFDDVRLRQIVLNYLSNALKFTATGSISLRCSHKEGQLIVMVVDTGAGMNDEQQASVFQPFRQVHPGTLGGTGLGLPISKKLAEAMGGHISMSSEPGVGTEMGVYIPAPIVTVQHKPTSTHATPEIDLSGSEILVVDDAADSRALLLRWCQRAGATVLSADSGTQALEEAQWADLVFMDMQMPDIDGDEVTRRLRAQGVQVPIIALTAQSSEADKQRCLQAGCDAFLSKPIKRHDLLKAAYDALAAK